jgi:Pectate lyase
MYLTKAIRITVCLCVLGVKVWAQQPVFRIDCNVSGRQLAEVLETGYTPWALEGASDDTARLSLAGGIQITLIRKGPYGEQLRTTWNKTIVQQPHLAKLTGDGFTVDGAAAGAHIEMRISGLPAGRHSILTYHNHVDNPATNTFAPIDIYCNGEQKYDNLPQTIRELTTANSAMAYLYADALAGQDVVLLFAADTTATANNKTFLINAIEINTPNPKYQAQSPYPKHADEHVDADNGSVTLSWTNAPNAVASRIYYGGDSASVADATQQSPLYKGRIAGASYHAGNQYSMNTYYWRIDQEDAEGNITHGNVWYYRPRQLAFKDAEGYGRFARGGRGGKVVHVTNLNDNGPGSLREAVTNNIGPRTIVFDVSGIIQLNSRLVLNQPYVTLAGQTAPGKGICIRSAPFGITGNDCIVRHMRVRVGSGPTYDGMGLTGANHSIMDHCSISWTIDEAFSSRGARNITLQRTLISEALNVANHQNYPPGTQHGYAATIGGDTGSFHHNLLAHCYGRNWSLGGGLDGDGYYTGKLDIRNNVVYNWGSRATDGGAHEVNFVNNYYKPGAGTTFFYAFNAQHENVGKGMQRCYFNGNVMPGRFDESNQHLGRRASYSNGDTTTYETFVNAPFFESYVTTQPARDAYKQVLSDIGCSQPVFDDHDRRIVQETMDSTFSARGSKSGKPGFPDSEQDVGGWEDYPEVHRPDNWDTDGDGLPNWFERIKRTNTRSPAGDFSDANRDHDRNGDTYLDEYLEIMAGPHYFTRSFRLLKIDLRGLARGFTQSPVFTLDKVEKGFALQLQCINGTVFFIALGEGISSFTFTVKDAEGSTMTRCVQIITSNDPSLYDKKESAVVSNAGAGNNAMASSIKIWPNPAKGHFNLLTPQTAKAMVIQIYNINGAMVGKAETVLPGITRSFTMNTPGTYLVTGTDKQTGEPVFVNKLVVK